MGLASRVGTAMAMGWRARLLSRLEARKEGCIINVCHRIGVACQILSGEEERGMSRGTVVSTVLGQLKGFFK